MIKTTWQESFIIKTANNETTGSQACKVTIPELSSKPLICMIYPFSKKYDILLGNPSLLELGAHIDLKTGYLKLENNKLPLLGLKIEHFKPGKNVITLPTHHKNGTYLLPEIPELGLEPGVVECERGKINIHTILKTDCYFNTNQITDLEIIDIHTSQETVTIDEVQKLIRCDHLSKSEKTQICKLIADHANTLKLPNTNLSSTDLLTHHINTTDDLPVYSRNYRYPFAFQEAIRKEITKLIDEKIIRPSNSPFNSPLWVVPKKADASGKKKVIY
jgi:hypothetical protein